MKDLRERDLMDRENILLEQLKTRFRIELERYDRSGIYGFTQRSLAYNSNKIEGSTLTERQTASIFETGTLMGEDTIFRTKDVEEMTGHFTMFNHMLKTYEQPLTEELIKTYHYKLKAGVFEDQANGYPIGEYKSRKNMVSDIITVTPEKVPEEMKKLLSAYESKKQRTLEDIMRFHADFEAVHPFQDGNGRVGRILIFKECLRNGMMPLIIDNNRKQEYYHFLNAAQQRGECEKLVAFAKQEQESYRDHVKDFLGIEWESPIQECLHHTAEKRMPPVGERELEP